MSRYLVIAHQTATSPELASLVRTIVRREPNSEFVLLVPATPVNHLLTWDEGETRVVARRRAEEGRLWLEQAGARVVRADIADASPVAAVSDELRACPDDYDGLIVSTLPPGVSRWLRMDAIGRIRRRFRIPVLSCICEPARQPAGSVQR